MTRLARAAWVGIGLLALGACAEPTGFEIAALPKGDQISVRALIAANPGKVGCIDYHASTNSCASMTRTRVSGNTLYGEEVTAVRSPVTGEPVRLSVVSKGRVVGPDACVKASGVKVGRGSEDKALAEFAVGFAKELIKQAGGVCGSYFRAGDGYVLSSRGADGQPFPPGDTAFTILDAPVNLRLQ